MIRVRALTEGGTALLLRWLETPVGELPRQSLDGDDFSAEFGEYEIDPVREFSSRLEFGIYLNDVFKGANFREMLSPKSDGLWNWLALAWFPQIAAKAVRRSEHYLVTRKGSAGSLAYRHAVRTSYELVYIHREYAGICLRTPMSTYGDMTEQLASRQTIAHNRGFFRTACELYIRDGVLRRGAASKPKRPKDRVPGDRKGLGSVRRLAIALQRLDLTFDTEIMEAPQMRALLPREFARWSSEGPG